MLKEKIKTAFAPSSTGVRRGLAVFALVLFIVPCFFLQVSAAETYNFVSSRPTVNNNSCYFEIVTADGSAYVFYVTLERQLGILSNNSIDEADEYSIIFKARFDGENLWVTASPTYDILSDVQDVTKMYGFYVLQDGTMQMATSGAECGLYIGSNPKSIKAYNCSCAFRGGNAIFAYANEINVNDKLDTIISFLQQSNSATNDIVGSINQGTQDVKDNQDKNTEAIIENDKQLQENEKNEANSTGDSGVSDVQEAVPDYSDNILGAFKELIDCFCHSNTDCSFVMPEFKTPAIAGIIPSFKIWDEFSIDFDYYLKKLPHEVVFGAQFLLSSGVLLWGVYELYDLIQYVVTLRKGGEE